jgi:hypothetical protein
MEVRKEWLDSYCPRKNFVSSLGSKVSCPFYRGTEIPIASRVAPASLPAMQKYLSSVEQDH